MDGGDARLDAKRRARAVIDQQLGQSGRAVQLTGADSDRISDTGVAFGEWETRDV